MYQERMNSYYPEVIRAIYEFNAIIDGEYPEFEELSISRENVLNDAYLTTMGESRIADWEKILNLTPRTGSTVDSRRDSVIAAIRGQGKLNTKTIENIIKTFTGGTVESWIIDSLLYIKIYPPSNNKVYDFDAVTNAITAKLPAHLSAFIYRNYSAWQGVKDYAVTWGGVAENFATWNDVKSFGAASIEDIFEYVVDESGNLISNELNDRLFN